MAKIELPDTVTNMTCIDVNSPKFVKWMIQCKCDLDFFNSHSKTCIQRYKDLTGDNNG